MPNGARRGIDSRKEPRRDTAYTASTTSCVSIVERTPSFWFGERSAMRPLHDISCHADATGIACSLVVR